MELRLALPGVDGEGHTCERQLSIIPAHRLAGRKRVWVMPCTACAQAPRVLLLYRSTLKKGAVVVENIIQQEIHLYVAR